MLIPPPLENMKKDILFLRLYILNGMKTILWSETWEAGDTRRKNELMNIIASLRSADLLQWQEDTLTIAVEKFVDVFVEYYLSDNPGLTPHSMHTKLVALCVKHDAAMPLSRDILDSHMQIMRTLLSTRGEWKEESETDRAPDFLPHILGILDASIEAVSVPEAALARVMERVRAIANAASPR